MTEGRRQKTEDRRRKSEARSQKPERCTLSSVLCSLAIVVLVVITTGCAVSQSSKLDEPRATMVQDEPEPILDGLDENQDEDFDLLEEDFEFLEAELDEQVVKVADPLEPLNRMMFNINDRLYFSVVKPIAQLYRDVTPEPARFGIRNFFNNLTTPIRFANCLLQGKNDSANIELRRFVVNTTEGVLGFGDPARDRLGLEPVEEDLGQTLAVHGIDNGFYIVLPLLGPSTSRDVVGRVGDLFLNPVAYVEPWEASVAITAGKMTNENSFRIGDYEDFKTSAPEPYVAMREVYIQYRKKLIEE
ncbi:MAG: MlaA family lipoprotein [Planctomycetota bacterium]